MRPVDLRSVATARVAEPREDAAKAPQEVTPTRTPASMSAIKDALGRAYAKAYGRPAPSGLVDVLSAHVALETNGGADMHNFNFGGIKAYGKGHAIARCMTRECLPNGEVRVREPFRAYANIDEGAADYLATMRGNFGKAYSLAERGDVDGFAHALKSAHYYTAPEADYVSALRGRIGAAPTSASAHKYETLALSGIDFHGLGSGINAPPDAATAVDSAMLERLSTVLASSSLRILGDSDD